MSFVNFREETWSVSGTRNWCSAKLVQCQLAQSRTWCSANWFIDKCGALRTGAVPNVVPCQTGVVPNWCSAKRGAVPNWYSANYLDWSHFA